MSFPHSMHAAHQYPRSYPGLVVAVSLFVKATKARDQGPCPYHGVMRVIGIAEVAPEPRMAQLPHHNPLSRLGVFYVSLSTAVHPIADEFLVHQDEQATGFTTFLLFRTLIPLMSPGYGGPGRRAAQAETVPEHTFIFFEQGQPPVDTLTRRGSDIRGS